MAALSFILALAKISCPPLVIFDEVDAFLDGEMFRDNGHAPQAHLFESCPSHDQSGESCEGHACRLGNKGDGTTGPRVDFEYKDLGLA